MCTCRHRANAERKYRALLYIVHVSLAVMYIAHQISTSTVIYIFYPAKKRKYSCVVTLLVLCPSPPPPHQPVIWATLIEEQGPGFFFNSQSLTNGLVWIIAASWLCFDLIMSICGGCGGPRNPNQEGSKLINQNKWLRRAVNHWTGGRRGHTALWIQIILIESVMPLMLWGVELIEYFFRQKLGQFKLCGEKFVSFVSTSTCK